MRIVIAPGGNAPLKRGQAMTGENQRADIQIAAAELAPHKFVGPVFDRPLTERIVAEKGRTMKPDGDKGRRMASSPAP